MNCCYCGRSLNTRMMLHKLVKPKKAKSKQKLTKKKLPISVERWPKASVTVAAQQYTHRYVCTQHYSTQNSTSFIYQALGTMFFEPGFHFQFHNWKVPVHIRKVVYQIAFKSAIKKICSILLVKKLRSTFGFRRNECHCVLVFIAPVTVILCMYPILSCVDSASSFLW